MNTQDNDLSEKKDIPPTYVEATKIRPLVFYPIDGSLPHDIVTTKTVSSDECIAHLKLISIFSDLREVISLKDGVFGLWDSMAEQSIKQNYDRALALIREKRWAVYVNRAVDRFQSWLETSLQDMNFSFNMERMTVTQVEKMKISLTDKRTRQPWSPETLPPLDVLMVWHSYMLNPRDFLEDCMRNGLLPFWAAGFPWHAIDKCISDTLDYVPSSDAVSRFENLTSTKWVNEEENNFKSLKCPSCEADCEIPWTNTKVLGSLDRPFEDGTGFADGNLYFLCTNCKCTITHPVLEISKFRNNVLELFKEDIPMPGTLLPPIGLPAPTPTLPEQTYANHLIGKGMSFKNWMAMTEFTTAPPKTIGNVRNIFEALCKDRTILARAGGYHGTSQNVARIRRISIRRMMSRYWNNHSPFSLDLVGAVLRQGSFVQKMDEIDWLHSPGLEKTMVRLIDKYRVFLEIIAKNPESMAVPTLDVDLAWHTHQLSPYRYYAYCKKHANTLINHDDKVEEGKLSDGFEWTSKEYQKMTGGQLYSTCTCWYCEAINESGVSLVSAKLFSASPSSRARENMLTLHKSPEQHSYAQKRAHISSHNAISPKGMPESINSENIRQQRLKIQYEKALRRLRKRGITTTNPKRDRGVQDSEKPYAVDGNVTNCDSIYGSNPACANFAAGAIGNCVGAMCGGRVAAAACMSGACGGGSAGGQAGTCSMLAGCGGGGGINQGSGGSGGGGWFAVGF